MKIVMVTPLLDHGGGQRIISELANHWAKSNHEVIVIVLRQGEPFYQMSKKIKIYELDYSGNGRLIKLIGGLKTLLKLRNLIKNIQPNFILSILSSTNILTLLATRFTGYKVFVRDVMSPYRKRKRLELYFRKILYKKASGVMVITEIAKNLVEAETGARVKVIPDPVRNITINKNVQREKIILNVGRLAEEKGQKYLLEVCAKIKKPDWKIVILGDGYLRKDLEKQIIELEIKDKVIMPGATRNVDQWLSKASIFAFTSISEAWGLALAEALVAGLPTVSFDCEVGPSHMINDGKNGFLVPVGDVDLMVSRIEELIENQDLWYNISNAAKNSLENLKIEKIASEILDYCSQN